MFVVLFNDFFLIFSNHLLSLLVDKKVKVVVILREAASISFGFAITLRNARKNRDGWKLYILNVHLNTIFTTSVPFLHDVFGWCSIFSQ